MTLNIDDNGTIFIYQGDSGEVVINGIADDNDYLVYFSIKDPDRNSVGSELVVNSNYNDYVTFFIPSTLTNLLDVPKGDCCKVYHYGIKICTQDIEDTQFVQGAEFGQLNNMIVFPKIVEGSYV